jgi:hypothetical protein
LSEAVRVWMEILFNIAYLIVVWGLVIVMVRRQGAVAPADRRVARLVRWAFALLALGDTGHVGFRVLAYAQNDVETTINLFGSEFRMSGMGFGTLSTAITVTIFYVLVLEIWRARFGQKYGWFEYLLLAATGVRFLLMIPAANQWDSPVSPMPWAFYRNLPLVLLGVGVAFLILRDAGRTRDRAFAWIGVMILVSYACYVPVILFVQQVPLVGMLMIPKTVAYVAVGFIAYRDLYRSEPAVQGAGALAQDSR